MSLRVLRDLPCAVAPPKLAFEKRIQWANYVESLYESLKITTNDNTKLVAAVILLL